MKDRIDYVDDWFNENEVMSREDYDNLMLKFDKEEQNG